MSFEPLKQAKAIGFTRTGDRAVDDKTDNLASKASLAARKFGIKAVRRTIVHPADAHKPSHEQRYVVALWRGVEEPKEA
jgi:hypothetical protein